MAKLKGKNLKKAQIFGQHFYTGCIEVESSKGKWYRLPVSEILPLLKDKEFITNKKKVHTYLTVK